MDVWPDVDNGVICGDCFALILIESYRTCRTYCQSLGLECVNAFEDSLDSCTIKNNHNCDTNFNWTSDALCQWKNITGISTF